MPKEVYTKCAMCLIEPVLLLYGLLCPAIPESHPFSFPFLEDCEGVITKFIEITEIKWLHHFLNITFPCPGLLQAPLLGTQ